LQAQNVRGVDVFPNDGNTDKAKPVDQFFACYLGNTAAELKDPASVALNYSALYTKALLDALCGSRPDLFEQASKDDDFFRYLMTRKLEAYLESEVPLRVQQRGLQYKVNQNPDAIITSHETWMACVSKDLWANKETPKVTRSGKTKDVNTRAISQKFPGLIRPQEILVESIVKGGARDFNASLEKMMVSGDKASQILADSLLHLEKRFGPQHFDTKCGIKVRGARVIEVFMEGSRARMESINVVINSLQNRQAATVLLKFEGNVGTAIPALHGFIAGVTFKDGELVDITYEPSSNDWRWQHYQAYADKVRALRATAASASQHGRFRLDRVNSLDIARDMQNAKMADPTLSIYAAYAYYDLQLIDRIRIMSRVLRSDIGVTFFDLALLGRTLNKGVLRRDQGVVPFFPLLSQGWSLLKASGIDLPESINGIELNMKDSLWSLFDNEGIEKLRNAIRRNEVL
jgi:hypothetical protein